MTIAATTLPKRPASSSELAAAIRDAAQQGKQVRLGGSNSMPFQTFDAAREVQAISTLRMNRVLDHAVADMSITVEAGITLEALQRHLAWQNQWLPIDPPAIAGRVPGQRTLGGLIATNSLGPLRFGSGGVLDWRLLIMGMKWVDGTGMLIAGGGRTVKNVAGYSTPRLMIGSAGVLGAIAEVTLRTFARPPDEQCAIFFCDSAEKAEALIAAILVSATTPAYLQAVGARTFAGNPVQLPAPSTGIIVMAGFLDRAQTCAAQIELVRALAAKDHIDSISQSAAPAGRLRLWMTTEPALPECVPFRLPVLSSQVCETLAFLEQHDGWFVSEAGVGMIRGVIAANAIGSLQGRATHLSASLQLFGTPSTPLALAARIKDATDAAAVFGTLLSSPPVAPS